MSEKPELSGNNIIAVVRNPYKDRTEDPGAVYFMYSNYPKEYHPETYICVLKNMTL